MCGAWISRISLATPVNLPSSCSWYSACKGLAIIAIVFHHCFVWLYFLHHFSPFWERSHFYHDWVLEAQRKKKWIYFGLSKPERLTFPRSSSYKYFMKMLYRKWSFLVCFLYVFYLRTVLIGQMRVSSSRTLVPCSLVTEGLPSPTAEGCLWERSCLWCIGRTVPGGEEYLISTYLRNVLQVKFSSIKSY